MVLTPCGQNLNETIGIQHYKSHSLLGLQGLIRCTQVLTSQFIKLLLIKDTFVPHLVNDRLCSLCKEEGECHSKSIKVILRCDIDSCI